jgi:molecular chaperone HtpG
MIDEISEDNEKYTDFYNNYGKNLKLGLYEDQKNREKLSEFLRFYTSKSIDEYRSLDQYISELGENDENIYYMTGESKESVDMSPFVEKLKKMGREVIYMVDAIDEYALQQLKEYKGKKLVSITKDNLKLDDDESIDEKEYVDLCKTIKEILDKKVENVKVSNRIVDSPCCLVTSEFGWSANMERIMRAQALGDDQQKSFMVSKKTMEVNPNHKIILELKSRLAVDKNDKTITDLVNLIYDISLLRCGFSLDNTQIFSNRLYRIIEMGLSIDDVDNSSNIVDDTLEDVVEESEMEEVD